jgi:hypothetical protein
MIVLESADVSIDVRLGIPFFGWRWYMRNAEEMTQRKRLRDSTNSCWITLFETKATSGIPTHLDRVLGEARL